MSSTLHLSCYHCRTEAKRCSQKLMIATNVHITFCFHIREEDVKDLTHQYEHFYSGKNTDIVLLRCNKIFTSSLKIILDIPSLVIYIKNIAGKSTSRLKESGELKNNHVKYGTDWERWAVQFWFMGLILASTEAGVFVHVKTQLQIRVRAVMCSYRLDIPSIRESVSYHLTHLPRCGCIGEVQDIFVQKRRWQIATYVERPHKGNGSAHSTSG